MAHKAVLVVDDEKEIREAVQEALELYGFPTIAARDGRDAFSVLQGKGEKPGLIILDLMMPGMDGRQFIEIKKTYPELKELPVVVITADSQGREQTVELGGDGFIKKPIEFNELLKVAEQYCMRDSRE